MKVSITNNHMKMKNIWIIIFLGSLLFGSCKKTSKDAYEVEKVFPDTEEVFKEFKKAIVNGQSVWKGTLKPKSGKMYSLYISLTAKGAVTMLADINPETGSVPKTAKFTLRSEKTNAIIAFSEGTYLDSIFVKKGRDIIAADTSYSFSYKKGDTIMLIGNRHGDELKLVTANVQERNAYSAGELGKSLFSVNDFFYKKPFNSVLTSSGYAVQFAIDQNNRSVIASYVNQNKVQTTSADFAYGINKIQFKKPIQLGPNLVYELFFDPIDKVFYMQEGTKKITFTGSNMPVIPLHQFIGNGFPSELSIPSPFYVNQLPGWSESYYYAWAIATSELNYSPYQAFLLVTDFEFAKKKDILYFNVYFDMGGQLYTATYPFSYTKTTEGIYTFKPMALDLKDQNQSNANLVYPYVENVVRMVTDNRLKLDYYETPNGLLAQFISQNNPDVYFTGMIGSLVK